jgi:hypothetical protein
MSDASDFGMHAYVRGRIAQIYRLIGPPPTWAAVGQTIVLGIREQRVA